MKRYAFRDEDEFRLIYESKTEQLSKLDIPISLSCVDRVTLSPWLHQDLSATVKQTLRLIDGCERLTVVRSTLINNEEWKRRAQFDGVGDAAK